MQTPAAQKNESGEVQDLRLYKKAAELAYQYAKNQATQESTSGPYNKDKNEKEEELSQ